MHDAQRDQFTPYLSLTRLQAVSYDATGDASRYLIAADPGQVGAAMRAKTRCVNTGQDCPPGTGLPDGGRTALTAGIASGSRAPSVVQRWTAYQKDRDRVVSLVDTGRRADAVGVLTGISQGGAAIDFHYFNVAMTRITGERRAAFAATFAATRSDLAPWRVLPPVVLGVAMLLVLAGVRAPVRVPLASGA